MSAEAQRNAIEASQAAQDEAYRRRMQAILELERASGANALVDNLGTTSLDPSSFQYTALDSYRPETESVVGLGPSAMQGISLDPATRAAQMQALGELSQMTEGDGMSAIDAANVADINRQIAQAQRGSRDAISANMRQRGIAGSGLELAAQLQAQQASADRASQAGLDEAANSMRRRMAALESLGSLGGNIRGQDFGEQAQIAGAQDAVSRFNAANRQDVYGRNTDRRNQAAEGDWRNRQGIANNNVSMRYDVANQNNNIAAQQSQFRNQTANQRYGREYDQAAMQSGIASDKANAASQAAIAQGQANAGMWGGIGQGVMQGANAYMQYDAAEQDREAKYGRGGQ
jgi:hypothetical protein